MGDEALNQDSSGDAVDTAQLAAWCNLTSRQAQRLIKLYRHVFPGEKQLSEREADQLMRARRLSMQRQCKLQEVLLDLRAPATEPTPTEPPHLDLGPLEALPEDWSKVVPGLIAYLEAHNTYYAAWEARVRELEGEHRGLRDEVVALREQIKGLTEQLVLVEEKQHHRTHYALRRAGSEKRMPT
jgi:hypothetical protein